MEFSHPLVRAQLIRRYKRFLADAQLENGDLVTAHCANPGAMTGLTKVGAEIWLSPAQNPARKLRWSWELIRVGNSLVGINTAHPNTIVAEAISSGRIPSLLGYTSMRREVKYGKSSRIDILLEDPFQGKCFVEVKNVHLKRELGAEFPDSVTARGTKHLHELVDMVAQGHRSAMFYLVQREDCSDFRIAADIDPTYNTAFEAASEKGVETLCYSCLLNPSEIVLDRPLPILLRPL